MPKTAGAQIAAIGIDIGKNFSQAAINDRL
jgi:hypothetical protein